ncbi:MAG TPA: hypothetical protein VEJ45_09715 [Candidatus Acidoferrales bacterium]|nr:hypothetical protein [Candidatus Acidoferrales bacterium]
MSHEHIAIWGVDWLWSLPLIALTVVIHVFGLTFIKGRNDRLMRHIRGRHVSLPIARLSIGGAALFITALHGVEGFLWAAAFQFLGALPDRRTAMLYSLNAMTSYGHVSLELASRWQLMGSLESLNGWILFGMSTAFLFSLVQDIWSQTPDRIVGNLKLGSAR